MGYGYCASADEALCNAMLVESIGFALLVGVVLIALAIVWEKFHE